MDLTDNDGLSALMLASKMACPKEVKELLKNEVDLKNNNEWSAPMSAYAVRLVKLLLENGAQVDLTDNDGDSALMLASKAGHSEVVKLLLANNAQVDLTDNDGDSALIYASQEGHSEVVKLLLANNAQVDLKDNDGDSALMCASQEGHSEVVTLLLENGAQDYRNNSDMSAALYKPTYNSGFQGN